MAEQVWIARDKDGDLYLYNEKPEKQEDCWDLLFGRYTNLLENTFNEVKWEDEEPLLLEDANGLKRTINTMEENHRQSQRYFMGRIEELEESQCNMLIEELQETKEDAKQAHEKNEMLINMVKQLRRTIGETTKNLRRSLEEY